VSNQSWSFFIPVFLIAMGIKIIRAQGDNRYILSGIPPRYYGAIGATLALAGVLAFGAILASK
jgi:hypothetical protein